jgi:hypothetical protein
MPQGSDRAPRPPARISNMLAPLADGRFVRLLLFGCWFSLFNGLILSPQNVFPNQVLGLSLFVMLALRVGLRAGQWPISPGLGRLVDRIGNRPVMIVSLLVVAQGPLFYYMATPGHPWWVIGAWVCWIAWAGFNVGLPNLMLKLSPSRANTPYIATYYALTGLCHGLSTLGGGALFDKFSRTRFLCLGASMDYYHAAFLFGWFTLSLGALLLFLVVQEPGPTVPSPSGRGLG